MPKFPLVAAAALIASAAVAQAPAGHPEAKPSAKPEKAASAAKDQYAVFVTSRGSVGVKLLPADAPKAVKNFVELAQGKKAWTDPVSGGKKSTPLYDGTLFHRVIPGFMIQGGDPLTRGAGIGEMEKGGRPFGTGGPGFEFEDELQAGTRPFATPCQLAMANHGPNTNGSQFFITEVPTPHLDPQGTPGNVRGYVHIGQGVCGCELVRQIATAGNSQTRLDRVVITTVTPTCK
jgi:peptidylprolyl isomerase/peptidyl-prolyl cis-trans isomerase A (cyclophilin A)